MSGTLTLMHGTCECAAQRIQQEGFRAHSYLTNSEELADYYAECAREECDHDCGGEAILNITVAADTLRADFNSYEEPLSFFRNEYTHCDDEWQEMIEEGTIPYPTSEQDHQTSLNVTWSAKTAEQVPAIHVVEL